MVYPGPAQPPPPATGSVAPGRDNRLALILAIVVGVLLLCCGSGTVVALVVGSNSDETTAAPAPAPAPAKTTTTTAPEEAEPTTEVPSKPATLPADVTYQGRGEKVVKLKPLSADYAHFAVFTHTGSSNFAVWSLGDGGEELDLVVNAVGKYSGARPLDFDDDPTSLRVEADGSWKIVVKVLEKAPVWPTKTSGKGPAVLTLGPGADDGLTTAKLTHKGTSNFAVYAYGDNPDLMVNEIGGYSGEVMIPRGTAAIAIEADGTWTMKPS
ncbi:hypothetical protein GCM10010435_22420 [Winogradskya consettensis]|uniref:Uncharacterized protein n=1 Tax=Winogradskya consettensis TaxID=113560 RepID=A0A919T2U5_9ACTN|nr:hypothetical protein [Actinoplanes consettensis]GIM85217.1 hypothetical protein Aco04nite_95130 [Actinoplanes consettensis]